MADGYTKLFSDIVDSSIWDEDAETKVVWVTLLALSNADGFVRGSVPWLANKARVDVNKCQHALQKLTSPDKLSRTPDNDGRRVEAVDRGWIILNYLMFRDRTGLSTDPRRAYQRDWMRKKRSEKKVSTVSTVSTNINAASASASVPSLSVGGVGGEPVNGEALEPVRLEAMRRLNLIFKREVGFRWQCDEEQNLFLLVKQRPNFKQEMVEIEAFYKKPENYAFKSLSRLLSSWNEALDKARAYKPPLRDADGRADLSRTNTF